MMLIDFLLFISVVMLIIYWLSRAHGYRGFLPEFAKLLDRPEIRVGLANYISGRSYLVGGFSGRKVTILLERGGEETPSFLVVSMETSYLCPLSNSDFEDHARDRAGELALFALKARHDMQLASVKAA